MNCCCFKGQRAKQRESNYGKTFSSDNNTSDQCGPVYTITSGGNSSVPLIVGNTINGPLNVTINHSKAKGEKYDKITDERLDSSPGPDIANSLKQSAAEKVLEKYKLRLQERCEHIFEGIAKESTTLLQNVYTELYIVEGEKKIQNDIHEVWQTEDQSRMHCTHDKPISCSDIFKSSAMPEHADRKIRTVLTKGIAGIGKTVSVQKFILDWTNGTANYDIDLIFLLPFRELNLIKDEQFSLQNLIIYLCPELQSVMEELIQKPNLLFIFDGLDESQIMLIFDCKNLSDPAKKSEIAELLANLIKGKLLPNAQVWITSRPAATKQIPSEYIHRVTEIHGFNENQKIEYFSKKIQAKEKADKIIKHIQQSRTLNGMCYIPVFCQILATVFQHMLYKNKEIPKTLTEMYTQLLLIQMDVKQQKYGNCVEKDSKTLLESNSQMLLKLAKLAFQQLMKGNVIFYEHDLTECAIKISEALVYSGICTEIFKVESVFFQTRVYCFVHLSIQEFMAAFYVFHCYECKNMEALGYLLQNEPNSVCKGLSHKVTLDTLLEAAVNKALKSHNGQLDLFIRFLMGLTLESNQRLLQGILMLQSNSTSLENMILYIKSKIQTEDLPTERIINLFFCLTEMNDQSLSKEIQEYLKSHKHPPPKVSSGQCSAIAWMLLMSEDALDELDKKNFNTTWEGYRRLIPAVSNCRKAVLAGCNLNADSCEMLKLALQKEMSTLRHLELSNNKLQDSGVELLCDGLNSSQCKLEILKLSGCSLTINSCNLLTSLLQPKRSSLQELDFSNNDLGDSGVKILADGLTSPHCKLEILKVSLCNLGPEACITLASILQLENSSLRQLDLNNNDLQDSGVKMLSVGMQSVNCKLKILRLSGCLVKEEGCSFLASALRSNPSHLIELDLTYNYTGDVGVNLLSNILEDPQCKLETLRIDKAEEIRIKSGLQKYSCELTLDPDTAHPNLSVCECRTVVWKTEQMSYPDHPERFDYWIQVLCKNKLSNRCYWEAEWSGRVLLAVAYRGISRKGDSDDCRFGNNEKSWCLFCSDNSLSACHNNKFAVISSPNATNNRVGVYVDWLAGILSFYSISSDTPTPIHLYTFHSSFTQPLYAGFGLGSESSVCVCLLE